MKAELVVLFLLLLLFIALSTKPLVGDAASPEPVLDASGKKLRVGASYYVVPVRGGSGFALASLGSKTLTCPLDVVVVEGYLGQPLTFIPVNPKKDVVRVSVDLNIKFSVRRGCSQSTVWKIDHFDRSTRKWFVTTGGVVGNPSWRTIENWFKIEKYGNDYKLVYCPTICEYCRVQCRDVALYEGQNGDKRLALTDVPYQVRFQQA